MSFQPASSETVAAACSAEETNVVLLLDERGRITFANRAVSRALGYAAEALIGREIAELLHPDDAALFVGIHTIDLSPSGAAHTLSPVSLFVRMLAADGRFVAMEPSGTNLLTDAAVKAVMLVLTPADARAHLDVVHGLVAGAAPLADLFAALAHLAQLEHPTLVGLAFRVHDIAVRRGTDCDPRDGWAVTLTDRMGEPIGALRVFFESGHVRTPFEQASLDRLARLARVGIDRHELERFWHRAASTDALTQLANRTGFNENLRSLRADESASLVLIDIDGFSEINDAYGLMIGDRVLTGVADRLRAVTRNDDLVARLGGDEFAVLCRGVSSVEQARRIATEIVNAIRAPMTVDGITLSVRASLGVCSAISGDTRTFALEAADEALHRAKREGRDRFTIQDAENALHRATRAGRTVLTRT